MVLSLKRKIISVIIMSLILVTPFFTSGVSFAATNTDNTIVVGVPTDRCPMIYAEKSEDSVNTIVGIGPDLLRIACKNIGYNVEFKAIDEPSLKAALDNTSYDLVMPFGSAIESASGQSSIVSDNLILTPFTVVISEGDTLTDFNSSKMGMVKSLAGVSDTVKTLYPNMEVILYESMSDCVEALRNDEVDALLQNSYVWSYVLQKPSYTDLHVQPTTMFSMDFRVGTLDTPEGQVLIDKLNQGISMITDTQRQAVILDYTSRKLYKYDTHDFLYANRFIFICFAALIILIALHFIAKQQLLQKAQKAQIKQMLDYDSLTGALTMAGFREKAKELLLENPTTPYLISYNNIKNFKFINDKMGMNSADELLCFWVEKSLEYFSDKEAIARIDADHFAVLCCMPDDNGVEAMETIVFEPVKKYYINQGNDYEVQISSGLYVLTPEDYKNINVDKMLDCARLAEKKAHLSVTGGYEVYNLDQWEAGRLLSDICGHFSTAKKQNEIQVWYQPQVNYRTGKIIGAEALCRWNHEKLGWLSPGLFIPMLEQSGLIYDLDCLVWETVCQNIHRWNEQGFKRSISVNLSRFDIEKNKNIAEHFNNLIQKYGLEPSQLRIEITETAYAGDNKLLLETTAQLQDLGFEVEMDDFGSGYSSLNMLTEIPVNGIKLDYIFLKNKKNPERTKIVIEYILKMLRSLKCNFITEGVETKEQADFLVERGCERMQGFYFYKPMPIEEFEALDFNNINNRLQ
ncbi:EAL domain-containing protein [Pseudobutyrivibrio xylanivorans]|uniref:EAL domain-containing protein n=1 Tax=Pseudobutyrivibrio xylanivorans TaxID=185007 RepID=A0A5P6VNY9_PSEXY|nr:EAL domain-containing protein [Pseudobutyrivibrio xylanivorans]QFJ54287.1 EAL domain-containing protein [Pseudobutyrivibrio xylanivorans]